MIGMGPQVGGTSDSMDNLFTLLTAVSDPKATKERLAQIAKAADELKASIAEAKRLNDDTKDRQLDIQRCQEEVRKGVEAHSVKEAELAGREATLAAAKTQLANDLDQLKAAQQQAADTSIKLAEREASLAKAEDQLITELNAERTRLRSEIDGQKAAQDAAHKKRMDDAAKYLAEASASKEMAAALLAETLQKEAALNQRIEAINKLAQGT